MKTAFCQHNYINLVIFFVFIKVYKCVDFYYRESLMVKIRSPEIFKFKGTVSRIGNQRKVLRR